jgi:hypothetical protein
MAWVRTGVSGSALATVLVDVVDARGPVPARVARALVRVDLAVDARRPERAAAQVPADLVVAHAAVQARARVALVDLGLAPAAREPREALAPEPVDSVDAVAVDARVPGAVVDVDLAVVTWAMRNSQFVLGLFKEKQFMMHLILRKLVSFFRFLFLLLRIKF